jgi:hypothetical protein
MLEGSAALRIRSSPWQLREPTATVAPMPLKPETESPNAMMSAAAAILPPL